MGRIGRVCIRACGSGGACPVGPHRPRLPSERRAPLSEVSSTALARIAVAVVVERRKAKSPWLDFIWRPVAVLVGNPVAAPWTPLNAAENTTLFYAGEAVIELYRRFFADLQRAESADFYAR